MSLQTVIEEYQNDELLFEVEYRHPFCQNGWINPNPYNEIAEDQTEAAAEDELQVNVYNDEAVFDRSDRRDVVTASHFTAANAEESPLINN